MSQNNTQPKNRQSFGQRNSIPRRTPRRAAFLEGLRTGSVEADTTAVSASDAGSKDHIAWFDYAKGICIVLVVMMHSTLGVEKLYGSEGFMHYVISFAKPFRMPDFFFLSALFLPMAMPRNWRHYLDKKVAHFAYFYLIWLVILVVFKAVGKHEFTVPLLWAHFRDAITGPYPALWFIYVLPLFFVVTKALDRLPGWLLLAGAVVLKLAPVHIGWRAVDDYAAHYYVFFVAGYLLSPHIFRLAEYARKHVPLTLLVVSTWALINGALAFSPSPIAGWPTLASLPVVSIVLGLAGAITITAFASLLSLFDVARFIRFCGRNSIVLYLSFTIPMMVTRIILHKTQLITDPGFAALVTWLVAVTMPLGVYLVLRHTPLKFLYVRPSWFGIRYTPNRKVEAGGQGAAVPAPSRGVSLGAPAE